LLAFSLRHHDEEDVAFVPTAEPAHPPIIDEISKRHTLAKPKELGLNVHGSHPHTSMARLGRTVNSAFGESPERNRTLKAGWAAAMQSGKLTSIY
jgi:hypothetical protein